MSGFIDYSSASHKKETSSGSKSGEESTGNAQGMGGLTLGKAVGSTELNGLDGEALGDDGEMREERHDKLTDQGKQHRRVSLASLCSHKELLLIAKTRSQRSSKNEVERFVSETRNHSDPPPAQSSSLTRSTSTGSRFIEELTHEEDQPREKSKGLKSSTLLFKRRSLKSPPPPLNKTTSRTDTFRSTTSQDSLQSASSRRIPSFARRENGETSPTIQRSPSLPSSPRSGSSMKLAPISSGGGRQRERSNPSPTSPVSRNGNLELTPQDRHYICRILTKSVHTSLSSSTPTRKLMYRGCALTALNSNENFPHSLKSVLYHTMVPPSYLTQMDRIRDHITRERKKGKVGLVS